jgi:SAM-dependent methyltransferase
MDAFTEELNIDRYLAGLQLYGDDFGAEEVRRWLKEEENGYRELGAADQERYIYSYHALNAYQSFAGLPHARRFTHVLGMGAAYGHELLPILHLIDKVTIVDPGFHINKIRGMPVSYLKPGELGSLPCNDNTFDLITSFSVLHHLPNVSFQVRELFRCLRPGGFLLLREPIISMGDWRYPRRGITSHERGIPIGIFRRILTECGFTIVRERKCTFSLMSRLRWILRRPVYNVRWCVALDDWISNLSVWSDRYHPRHVWHKVRPWSVAYILQKPGSEPLD